MGWKGTMRSISAAQRQYEREAQRQRRELQKQQQKLAKMQELEKSAYEVQLHENYISSLLSVHKNCSDIWDWKLILLSELPIAPTKFHSHENSAQFKLDKFKPRFFDKVLGRSESKRMGLISNVEEARKIDNIKYHEALKKHGEEYAELESTCELADRILSGDIEAYLDAIKKIAPFDDIAELGSLIEFHVKSSSIIEVILHVNDEEVIPSETKCLLKSGKLSEKKLPKSKFYELYQDYVSSCVLRVARELFALLPIDIVISTTMGNILNTQTGYMEENPILSVVIPRKTLDGLNFEMMDPSDSMKNFVHRVNFKKTKGFSAVVALMATDLEQYDGK